MSILLVVLLVLAVGAVAAVASGAVRGGLPAPGRDLAPPLTHPLAEPGDLDAARFAISFRGYRMDQVDEVLDAARDRLAERDAEVARLRHELAARSGVAPEDLGDGAPDVTASPELGA